MRLAPFLAVLAIAVAGCASAGASGDGGAAALAPGDAVAFVDASADAPDWLLAAVHWSDVRQFAGGEVDVAVLPGGRAVAFLQPSDRAKLATFAATHDAVTRTMGDWTAVAHDAATLDAVAAAKTRLAQDPIYLEAMDALPDGAIARAYATGDEAQKLFASIPGQLESRLIPSGARYRFSSKAPSQGLSAYGVGVQEFRWLAASLTKSGDGLKLDAIASHGDLVADRPPRLAVKPIDPYTPALVDEIPSGALAVVDFKLGDGAFEVMPKLPKPLSDVFGGATGTLPSELDALFGGETAVYVRAALPMPEVTLVTQPTDTTAASDTLDSLLRSAPALSRLALHRAVIGGQFVVSTTQQGIDDFRSGGAKLSTDRAFLDAKKQSGLPDRTTGFVYVDAGSALPLLALAGVKLPKDLPQLRNLVVYGAQSKGQSSFTAFLGVG
jgi:hypothetical protein